MLIENEHEAWFQDAEKVISGVAKSMEDAGRWADQQYFKYLMVTAAYGLDFWERTIFNGVVLGTMASSAYLLSNLIC